MIKVNNCARGTGKSTKVMAWMARDTDIYCIVPTEAMKLNYPKELRSRMLNANRVDFEYEIRSNKIKRVVLDEGFLYDPEKLLELYYLLGYLRIDVMVYGTAN